MTAPSSPRKWLFASLFAALLGLIDTAILTAQHFRIANEGLMQKSFCTFSSLVDCDTALTSAYAHVWNIPSAELGFLYYAIVAIVCSWALASETRRHTILQFLCLSGLAASAYSIYMAYLLVAELHIICIFCLASHLLTLLIWIFSLVAIRFRIKDCGSLFGSQKAVLAQYVILRVLVGLVGVLFFRGINKAAHSGPPQIDAQALIRHFYAQRPLELTVTDRPAWGPDGAPVTIIEFSDFQCPFCRRAAFSLKPFTGQFRDEVRIVYLNYPLDASCNPAMEHAVHPMACLAAKAALCVYQEKGNEAFWKYHDLIFENQKRLSHSLLTNQLASAIGMSAAELDPCIISPRIESRLAADIELGTQAGIEGTPAIYINGRSLSKWMEPSILRAIIKSELERLQR